MAYYYIICLSIISRLLVTFIQLSANLLITDHDADAYRNKYFEVLNSNSTLIDIPPIYHNSYKVIEGFTKWDGQYFLEISLDGYIGERHLAFLPLFPIVITTVRQYLYDHRSVNLNGVLSNRNRAFKSNQFLPDPEDPTISIYAIKDYIKSVFAAYTINNFFFFPIAALLVYSLTMLIGPKKDDDKYAKNVAWWFCFNPASVFFSACYTESLFAVLTFSIMYLIEEKAEIYIRKSYTSYRQDSTGDLIEVYNPPKTETFIPLNHLNRLLSIYLSSLALLAVSSAARSNGLLTIGFLAYQFLLKYLPIFKSGTTNWSILYYIYTILEVLQDFLVFFMSAIIAASGYITFQIFSYTKFCSVEEKILKLQRMQGRGKLSGEPEWCNSTLPHAYQYVQKKYWSVGAFEFYEFKQLPNFLLAIPITYLVLSGSLRKSRQIVRDKKGDKRQLAYYIQAIVLTIFCAIFSNIQVTTRLLAASCPAVYWIMADMSEQSRWSNRILVVYCIGYLVIGTILHVNFYPWT